MVPAEQSCSRAMQHRSLTHVVMTAVRLLREELQLLQEPGSYVGEVIKVKAAAARNQSHEMGSKRHVAATPGRYHMWQIIKSCMTDVVGHRLINCFRCQSFA